MTIAAQLLPAWLSTALWLCMLLICALAIRYADWPALRADPGRYHLVFGGSLSCLVLWLVSVNAFEGLWFHFMGMTSLTLLLGWRFAILAGTVAVIGHTLILQQSAEAISTAWLLTVAVPATVSRLLVHRLRRFRSRNLFVYMLGAGFGGGLLSMLAVAVTALPLLWLSGQQDWVLSALAHWPLILLLMFPEGFINGMVITTLTVFYPDLVKTFDDTYYLEDG